MQPFWSSCSARTRKVKRRERKYCTTKRLKRAVSIKASAKSARSTLKRAGRVYVTGTLRRSRGSLRLVLDLNQRKTLPSGAYTLTLRWKAGKTRHTSRQRITLE